MLIHANDSHTKKCLTIPNFFDYSQDIDCWVFGLCIAHKEVQTNYDIWQIIEANNNPSPSQYLYLIRAMAGHLYEIDSHLNNFTPLDFASNFLDSLPVTAQQDRSELVKICSNTSFAQVLKSIRLSFAHYPQFGGKQTMTDLKSAINNSTITSCHFEMGNTYDQLRLTFVDEILASYFGGNSVNQQKNVEELRDFVNVFFRLFTHIWNEFLKNKGYELATVKPNDVCS